MATDINITIRRLEESAVCDLTQKTGEAVVCVLPGDMEVIVGTTKLLEMIRFEHRKLDRKNRDGSPKRSTATGTTAAGTPEK